jgi:hypothetical protein
LTKCKLVQKGNNCMDNCGSNSTKWKENTGNEIRTRYPCELVCQNQKGKDIRVKAYQVKQNAFPIGNEQV